MLALTSSHRAALPLLVLVLVAACSEVTPTNPYDLATPALLQAPASLSGRIVLAEQGAVAAGLVVKLFNESGAEVLDADGKPRQVIADALPGDGEGSGLASFKLGGLPPGAYRLEILADARFAPPTIPEARLRPGQDYSVGTLTFSRLDVGSGRVSGEVRLNDARGGPREVRLYRRVGTGLEVVATQRTDATGHFELNGLAPGTYAMSAELTGFTPDFRSGFTLAEDPGALVNEVVFNESDALVLYPVSAVLEPAVQQTFGQYYTKESMLPLKVLAFGAMNEMRLSTTASFLAEGGVEVAFIPYSAQTTITLPVAEGPVTIYAQFRKTTDPDFPFTSQVFTATAIRDASPPEVISAIAGGTRAGSDGTAWVISPESPLGIVVTGNDLHSAVASYAVVHNADNSAGDLETITFKSVESPTGLMRVEEPLTVTAGDGPKSIWVYLRDRAGNTSAATEVKLAVDTHAPTLSVPLAATNAETGNFLVDTFAQLHLALAGECPADESGAVIDCPIEMRVGVKPLNAAGLFAPFEPAPALPISGEHGQIVQFEAWLRDPAGNVTKVESEAYTLRLQGSLSSQVFVEGVPEGEARHGGTTVRLFAPGKDPDTDAALVETSSASDGRFVAGPVPEASGYTVELRRVGSRVTRIAGLEVVRNRVRTVGPFTLATSRGAVKGLFLLGDNLAQPTAHGGILVSALLGGKVIRQTVTALDGSYLFAEPGLPTTVGVDRYTLLATSNGYVPQQVTGLEVFEDQTTVVKPSEDETVPRAIELAKIAGDFELCAATGDCVPLLYTNQNQVRLKLRSTIGVTAYRVRARTDFEGDAELPAWSTFTEGQPILVDVAGTQGTVNVYLQLRIGTTAGSVLQAGVVYDTTPPVTTALRLERGAQALLDGYTNADLVRATVEADAGGGTGVAPLRSASVIFATTAPTTIPTTATGCLFGSSCLVPLPGRGVSVREGVHDAWAFSCDEAANCSAVPLQASILYDVTPPKPASGVDFSPVSDSLRARDGKTYTRSSQYRISLTVGTAKTGANAPAPGLDGNPRADVIAYRFGFAADLSDGTFRQFETVPAPAAVREVAAPSLPAQDGEYRVYGQFRDAAGNSSDLGAGGRSFALVLDSRPPLGTFTLNGGAAWTNDPNVTLGVTLPVGDNGPAVEVQLATDGGRFENPATRTLPLTPSTEAFAIPALAAPGGDGPYTVSARLVDAAGNSADRSATINLDRTAPSAIDVRCGTCRTFNGLLYTNNASRQVVLDVLATDNSGRIASVRTAIDGGAPQLVDYTGTVTLVLPDLDGAHTLAVSLVDLAGNISPATTLSVILDRVAPTLSVVVEGNSLSAEHVASAGVSVTLTASDAGAGVIAGLRLSNAATFTGASQTFAPIVAWTLSSPELDGEKTVYAEITDAAGNVKTSSDTIVLDTTSPAVTLALAGGDAFTTGANVAAALTATDALAAASVLRMQLSVDPTFSGAIWEPFAAAKVVALPAGDGPKSVFLRVRDLAGNIGNASDSIVLDTVGPESLTLALTPDTYAKDTAVIASLAASGATQMCFWGDFAGSPTDLCANAASTGWTATTATRALTLTAPDGPRVVNVKVRDGAGLTSAAVSATVILDRAAPSGLTFKINQGSLTTRARTVSLDLTADDALSGVAGLALANGALTCATAVYEGFQNARSWTLTTGDGAKTVTACFRDGAGNTSTLTASIILDETAPSGVSALIAAGAAFVTDRTVSVALAGTDNLTAAAALEMQVSEDPTFAGATWEALASAKTVLLSNGDGYKALYLRVRDAAGNMTTASDSIVVDTEKPFGGILTLGGLYTTVPLIAAGLGASGATQMCLWGEFVGSPAACGPSSTGWEATLSSKALTLTAAAGLKTVNVKYRDGALQEAPTVTSTITLDTAGPTGTQLVINTGATVTNTRSVSLDLAATDALSGVAGLALANGTLTCAGAVYEPFVQTRAWTLATVDGAKTVTACFKDGAGNTTTASATITLDETAPTGVSVVIASGAASATNAAVTLAIAATDNLTSAAALQMQVSEDPTFSGIAYAAFAATKALTLSSANGIKTVYVRVKDGAGNTTQASDTITLDTEAPYGASLVLESTTYTRLTAATVSLGATGATRMCLWGDFVGSPSDSCIAASAGWEGLLETKALTLTSTQGTKTVNVKFRDDAGLVSDPAVDTVIYDSASPTGSGVTISGGATVTGVHSIALDLAATDSGSGLAGVAVANGSLTCASATYDSFGTARLWTLASGDGTKTVTACFRDNAGNTSTASATITLDETAPTGVSVSIAAGAGFTTAQLVSLTIAASDNLTAAGSLQMQVAEDPTFAGIAWETLATTKALTLSSGEGSKTVYVRVKDGAGNTTTASDGITLDTQAPTGVSIALAVSDYTNAAATTVALGASGATQMCLWGDFAGAPVDACAPSSAAWEAALTSKALTFTSAPGTKTVNVKFRDGALQESATASDSVIYDTAGPTSASLSIAGGALFSNTRTVTLDLNAVDALSGLAGMSIGNGALTCASATYEPFARSRSWTLTTVDGSKTVTACFRDNAGNTSTTSATITLDETAPTGVTVTIAAGAAFTTSTTVSVALAATDAVSSAAALRMQVSEDPTFAGVAWVTFAASQSVTLSSGDGAKAVYLRVRDEAGNIVTASDGITLDTDAPTNGSLALAVSDYTNAASATVTLAASGATQMCLWGDFVGSPSDSCIAASTGWESFLASKALTLSAANGIKTVSVLFRDAARQVSGAASDSVVYDTNAPASLQLRIAGGATHTTTRNVALELDATDALAGLVGMAIADGSLSCASATYEAFTRARSWTLPTVDGAKTLVACFKDRAGNTATISSSLILDETAPTGLSVSIASGAAWTTGTAVTVALAASDNLTSAGALLMQLSQDPTFAGVSYETYATTKAVTLSSGDGLKVVYLRVKDQAGNTANASDLIILDTDAPSNPALVLTPTTYTSDTAVTAALSANGASEMCLYGGIVGSPLDSCVAASAGWESYLPSKALTLSAGTGTKTVNVKFRDAARLVSAIASDSVVYDTAGPASASVAIDGGATITGLRTVTLALAATDVLSGLDGLSVANGALTCATATYESFQASRSWTLTAGDGTKTVTVCFRDGAGNTTSASTTITLDETAPSSLAVNLNASAAYATSATVTAALTATDNLTSAAALQMQVSQDPTFNGASWETFAASKSVTLTAGDGVKVVYLRVKDLAGNLSTASDTITLDTEQPYSGVLTLAPSGYTNLTATTASLGATGATQMCLYGDLVGGPVDSCGAASSGWESVLTSKALTLTSGDGLKTVNVKYRDAARQVSDLVTATVMLDQLQPALTVVVEGGTFSAEHVPQGDVVVTLTASDASPIVGMRLSNTSVFSGALLPLSTSVFWTLATPELDGAKSVFVEITDQAGNTRTSSDTIVLDTTPPTAGVTLDSGATYTQDLTVGAALTASDVVSSAANLVMQLSDDPTFAGSSWLTFAATRNVTISSGDGPKAAFFRVRDQAGNIGTASASIILDTTAPSAPAVTLSADPYTKIVAITAALSVSGASEMCLFGDFTGSPAGCGPTSLGWTTFAPSQPLTLTSGDGVKSVTARFRDAAGWVSTVASDTVIFDATAPTSASVVIEATAATTRVKNVTLALAATDVLSGLDGLAIVNGPTLDCATAVYEAVSTSRAWTLPAGDGTKTVTACVRDRAGNTATAADTIVLDETAPSSVSISIASGASYATNASVALALTASDNLTSAAALQMQLSVDPTFADATWITYSAAPAPITLSPGDGVKAVYLRVRDLAGNLTTASDTIVLDTERPYGGSLTLATTEYTNVTAAVVTLGVTGATQMCLYGDIVGSPADSCATAGSTGWESVLTSKALTLTSPSQGLKVVNVVYRDAAGLQAKDPFTDAVVYDTGAPTGLSLQINGGASYSATPAVTVDLGASTTLAPLTGMSLINGTATCATATYITYGPRLAWTLATGDGLKTVSVCFQDAAGNTASTSAAITLDQIGPTGVSLTVNAGAQYTTSRDVSLAISASDDVSADAALQMMISGNNTFSGASWETYATTKSFRISSTGEGFRTVYLKVKDAAGNESLASDGILVDTTLPVVGSGPVTVNGSSATSSTNEVVTVALNATGATKVKLRTYEASSTNGSCSTAPTVSAADFASQVEQTYAPALTVVLPPNQAGTPPPDECKWIVVLFGDDAGNYTSPLISNAASVLLDPIAPTAPQIGTEPIIVNRSSIDITLATNASDAHLNRYQVRYLNSSGVPEWKSVSTGVSTTEPYLLTSTCLTSATLCQFRVPLRFAGTNSPNGQLDNRIAVRALDSAGNVSDDDNVAIVSDQRAPVLPANVTAVPAHQRATLTWTANIETDVAGYRVHYKAKGSGACPTSPGDYDGAFAEQGASPIDVGMRTNFVLTALPNGGSLCVGVSAYDRTTNPSANESPVSSTFLTPWEVAPVRRAQITAAQLGVSGLVEIGAMVLRNGLLYLAVKGTGGGLFEIDVSNEECLALTSPVAFAGCTGLVKSTAALADPRMLVLNGGYAWVADGTAGLKQYRIIEGSAPVLVRTVLSTVTVSAVAVSDRRLAVGYLNGAVNTTALYLLPSTGAPLINVLATPEHTLTWPSTVHDLELQGNLLAVGTGHNVSNPRLVDISTPTAPVAWARQCDTTQSWIGLELIGQTLFYATASDRVETCDLSSTAAAYPIRSTASAEARFRLQANGPYLFVAGAGHLDVFDVSSRYLVGRVGSYDSCGFADKEKGSLATEGHRVFTTCGDGNVDLVLTGEPRAIEYLNASTTISGDYESRLQGDAIIAPEGTGYGEEAVVHLGRNGLEKDNTADVIGLAYDLEWENDQIVGLGVTGYFTTRRAVTGRFEAPVAANWSPATQRSTAGLVRWPFLLAATHTNSGSPRVLSAQTYDTRSMTNTDTQVLGSLAVNSATDQPDYSNRLQVAYYGGYAWFVLRTTSGTQASQGIYRVTFDDATGLIGNTTTKVMSVNNVIGIQAYGRRLFYWRAGGVQWESLTTPAADFEGFTVPGLTGLGENRPVFAGPWILTGSGSLRTSKIEYDVYSVTGSVDLESSTATSVATYDTGTSASGVHLAGDRIYLLNYARPTFLFKLR